MEQACSWWVLAGLAPLYAAMWGKAQIRDKVKFRRSSGYSYSRRHRGAKLRHMPAAIPTGTSNSNAAGSQRTASSRAAMSAASLLAAAALDRSARKCSSSRSISSRTACQPRTRVMWEGEEAPGEEQEQASLLMLVEECWQGGGGGGGWQTAND